MKLVTMLTIAFSLSVASVASAQQCPSNRSQASDFQPTSTSYYQPVYSEPVYSSPIYSETVLVEPPYAEPPPQDPGLAAGVSYDVQLQNPLTFDWQTVRTFDSESTAEEYANGIEQRHWIIYSTGSSNVELAQGLNLADARSKAATLRRTGTNVRAIQPIQVQVTEESFEEIFDQAIGNVAEQPVSSDGVLLTSVEASKVPNELRPLLGLWEAVTRDAEGQVSRILLNLKPDGTADMTVPTASGGEATIHRKFAVEDSVFKLTDGENELTIGDVVQAGPEKVVLNRDGADITFLRP